MSTMTTAMPPTPGTIDAAASTIGMLADPTRLTILWWLGEGERNATELCRLTGRPASSLSHHTSNLELRGLVVAERRGMSKSYSLTDAGRAVLSAAIPFIHSH